MTCVNFAPKEYLINLLTSENEGIIFDKWRFFKFIDSRSRYNKNPFFLEWVFLLTLNFELMKKIILLLFTFSILSCSKDDNTSSYKGKNDLLIEGSPWVYHHAEILKITNNTTPPKTKEELSELVDFQNQFLSYDFNRDGSANITVNEDTTHSFNYKLDTEKQIIEFENETFYTLENIEVNESEFSHTIDITFAPQPDNRVSFTAKLFFKKN